MSPPLLCMGHQPRGPHHSIDLCLRTARWVRLCDLAAGRSPDVPRGRGCLSIRIYQTRMGALLIDILRPVIRHLISRYLILSFLTIYYIGLTQLVLHVVTWCTLVSPRPILSCFTVQQPCIGLLHRTLDTFFTLHFLKHVHTLNHILQS